MSKDHIHAVELETITACNRRCSYCPNASYDRSLAQNIRHMEIDFHKEIISQLAEIPTIGIFSPHFYGEPLLDERLPSLSDCAHRKIPHMEIQLYSNGDLHTVEKYQEFINTGVRRFIISEHGPVPTA